MSANPCDSWNGRHPGEIAVRTFRRNAPARIHCQGSREPAPGGPLRFANRGSRSVTAQTIITLILRLRDTQGVTALLATHRLQDAFGLASYRFDGQSGKVVPVPQNGASQFSRAATNFAVLREGKVYFEGSPLELADTRDTYLRRFLL